MIRATTLRRATLALLLALAAACARGDELAAGIQSFVEREMLRQRVPGVAVAVVLQGKPLLARGFGFANLEHTVPVTARTVFQSGSLGKQFTALLLAMLAAEGTLSLDDTLGRFFPEAPPPWSTVTLRQLLTHTSGMPDYTEGLIDLRRDYSEDELVALAWTLAPEFEPGSTWRYSNTGYVLLGAVVRKATGRFYGDLLRERVFRPLGMPHARVISEADIVSHRAAGYRLVDGVLQNQEWVAPQLNTTADGALYLSLVDMLAWHRALRARALLPAAGWEDMFRPVRLSDGSDYPYGLGWRVDSVADAARVHHSGSWQGFKAYIARYAGADLGIIVMSNLAEAEPARFVDGIAALIDPALVDPGVEAP